jgi:hypothetical protein
MIGFTLVLLLQLGDLADFPADARAEYAGLPREVRVLMDRRQACLYWGGEYSGDYSDPDPQARDAQRIRDRQIIRTQNRLRCGIVEREEARLRRRYATDSTVLKALDETRDWLP